MKLQTTAAILLIILSLMSLPAGFADDDIPLGVAVLISALGVLGLVAGIALLRRVDWGAPTVLAVAAANIIAAVAALIANVEGAVIGLVIGSAIVAASLLGRRQTAPAVVNG